MMGNPDWETPDEFFNKCSEAFGPFGIDAAASQVTTKCARFFDEKMDALGQDWGNWPVWVNPPFVKLIGWVRKAIEESDKGLTVVMLLPNDTDPVWFHLLLARAEIYITKGRIKFIDPEGGGRSSPRQGHIVAVLRPPVIGLERPTGILGTIDA
jgi:phage N-6-adenine-methyltransferase